jgi:biotin transporter BioY
LNQHLLSDQFFKRNKSKDRLKNDLMLIPIAIFLLELMYSMSITLPISGSVQNLFTLGVMIVGTCFDRKRSLLIISGFLVHKMFLSMFYLGADLYVHPLGISAGLLWSALIVSYVLSGFTQKSLARSKLALTTILVFSELMLILLGSSWSMYIYGVPAQFNLLILLFSVIKVIVAYSFVSGLWESLKEPGSQRHS